MLSSNSDDDIQPDRPLVLLLASVASLGVVAALLVAVIAGSDASDVVPASATAGTPLPLATAASGGLADKPTSGSLAEASTDNPVRSVFLLGDRLAPAHAACLLTAIDDAGLPSIEREHIDTLLVEQDLARQAVVDVDTCIRLGRLLGGHVALIAQEDDGMVGLRAVLVESGEVLAARCGTGEDLAGIAAEMLATVCSQLPATGRLDLVVTEERAIHSINLGRQHGIREQDRFAIYSGPPDRPGAVTAVATVQATAETSAVVTINGSEPHCPVMVRRYDD